MSPPGGRPPAAPEAGAPIGLSPARDRLVEAVQSALVSLGLEGAVPMQRPNRAEHGDWASPVALGLAKRAGRRPRDLAEDLAAAIRKDPPPHLEAVEVAGPGFLNFTLNASWLHEELARVVRAGVDGYACPDLGQGETVQIEFVSANPTGPLHMGNGWLASYGDSLARIMARCGYRVSREYYVNDTGGQMRRLGESLLARHRGEEPPQDGYHGDYLVELARSYDGPADVQAAGRWAAEQILASIRATLDRLDITFDEWKSQASIEEGGAVEETIALLSERGLVYEQGGALWLRSTAYGDTRDRVLRKSADKGGDYTYLAGDLAYHRDKFLLRGFDRVINVWGADHQGQVPSLLAGVEALGVERGRLEVEIGQMISLVEDGRSRHMSKRAGHFVTMDSVVERIGPEATRLLSLVSSIDQATTVDLGLLEKQNAENPVYYVQYAHARIASIGRVAAERGVRRRLISEVDLSLLTHEREEAVLRILSELPDTVVTACVERAPHKVTTWVRELAARFHGFYHDCYVMGEGVAEELTQARLWLVEGARVGLAIGLGLLGVEAPESM